MVVSWNGVLRIHKENFVEETESLRECQRRPSLSNQRGGSTAAQRLQQRCFAVRSCTDKYSQGCNNLIKHKKTDVLGCCRLGLHPEWDIREEKPVQKQLFGDWKTMNKKYDYLLKPAKN
jgi:hypothetical protein